MVTAWRCINQSRRAMADSELEVEANDGTSGVPADADKIPVPDENLEKLQVQASLRRRFPACTMTSHSLIRPLHCTVSRTYVQEEDEGHSGPPSPTGSGDIDSELATGVGTVQEGDQDNLDQLSDHVSDTGWDTDLDIEGIILVIEYFSVSIRLK